MPPVDLDLACAVALGIVEAPRWIVNQQQINILDPRGATLQSANNWLIASDPLHQLTKHYLDARTEAQKASSANTYMKGYGNSTGIKTRDEANQRANLAKCKARQLLAEHGVLARAQSLGFRVQG